MNNQNTKVKITHCLGTAAGCWWLLASSMATAAETAQTTVTITANVYAVCTVSAPSTVALPDIPHTAVAGKSAGQDLSDYTNTFELTATCSGTNKYNYTFKPSVARGQCVGSNSTDMLRFCLDVVEGTNSNKRLDMSSASGAKYSTTGDKTTIRITPQTGATQATAISYSGTFDVTIAPE